MQDFELSIFILDSYTAPSDNDASQKPDGICEKKTFKSIFSPLLTVSDRIPLF